MKVGGNRKAPSSRTTRTDPSGSGNNAKASAVDASVNDSYDDDDEQKDENANGNVNASAAAAAAPASVSSHEDEDGDVGDDNDDDGDYDDALSSGDGTCGDESTDDDDNDGDNVVSSSKKRKVNTNSETEVKRHQCQECGRLFKARSYLNRHMKIHRGERLHQCNVCGKKFSRTNHLKDHMNTHTGEKPYKCRVCGKRTADSSSLSRHMKRHTGEKPYSCEICQKAFSDKVSLKHHMVVHSGRKDFECKECHKKFSRNAHLKRHMVVHEEHKPFQCPECEKRFSQESHLKRHMVLHTGNKPFECNECGRKFYRRSHLQSHMNVHKTEPSLQDESAESESVQDEHATNIISNIHFYEDSTFVSQQAIAMKFPQALPRFVSVNSHPHIAATYGLKRSAAGPMLVMEKIETSMFFLLGEGPDILNVKERVDLACGIVHAVDYFHHHLKVPHGLIRTETVFITSQMTAKVLDPIAAFLVTGETQDIGALFEDDIKQLVGILLMLLNDHQAPLASVCTRLQEIADSIKSGDNKRDKVSSSHLITLLSRLRQTEQYRSCPRLSQLHSE
jgi:hypothetical protein